MSNFKKPTENDLLNPSNFGSYVNEQQQHAKGLPRTTASMNGTTTYGATSFNISDILQGTFAVKDPADQLLILNKAATNDLENLYTLGADSLSAYGSRGTSQSISSGQGSSAGGSGGGSSEPGAQLKEEWVMSLPKTHPTSKAIIWVSNGKASRESHLPTSEDLQTDIAQHKQYPFSDPTWKHPWSMDRVGGGQAGEVKIYYDVTEAETVIGEDGDAPGQHGAFGYLSPEDEQFYCAMAWPYKGDPVSEFARANEPEVSELCKTLSRSDYVGKRILVYSVEKKTAVVCVPGEWGPHPYYSNNTETRKSINGFIIGLSMDTHYALGTDHGTEVRLGWVDDNTPLGPYAPTADQALVSNSGGRGVNNGSSNDTVSTAAGDVNIDDLKNASLKILNHPNCWMGKPGQRIPGQQEAYATSFTSHMTNGQFTSPAEEVIFKDNKGKQYLFPSVLNYLWYILEGGFILDYYVGSIVHKDIKDTNRRSNHSFGGAIDINCIGIASEGKVYPYSDANNWRRVSDKMFNYLATLPENTKPSEVGSTYAFMYPNNFKVFKDGNPTHLHLGFTKEKTGTLLSVLKVNNGISSNASSIFNNLTI